MTTYILDACALIAVFNGEKGADAVSGIINSAAGGDCSVLMNKYNLLEVYYGYFRDEGEDAAEQKLEILGNLTVMVKDTLTDELMRMTGKIKSSYKCSLADAVLLAQALMDNAIVVTADHHEMDAVERDGKIQFLWLR